MQRHPPTVRLEVCWGSFLDCLVYKLGAVITNVSFAAIFGYFVFVNYAGCFFAGGETIIETVSLSSTLTI